MAQNVYEGLFILDSNRYARNPADVSGEVAQLLEKHGGEVLVSRLWEERRLAYPINGQRKGTYWLTYFRLEGEALGGLTQETHRSDNILRHLFLKVDPRIVDHLVAHASDSQVAAEPAETTEAPAEGEKKAPAEGEKAAASEAPAAAAE